MSNLLKDAPISIEMAVHYANQTHSIDMDNSTIRKACRLGRISGAEKVGKTWYMPIKPFESWLLDPSSHKPGPKKVHYVS